MRLSVIVPTFNEADNVAQLLAQLIPALAGITAELIFVDDSSDATPEAIAKAADDLDVCFSVRIHHRTRPDGGLGGAVLEGLRMARGDWVVVLDADLQHPPALVPDLIKTGDAGAAQLVVASRYAGGGSSGGLDGPWRRIASAGSGRLAKALFPNRLSPLTDPMSGFFAVRRSALDLDALRPLGYKILLELVVGCRLSRVTEVPYTFQPRFAGASKSTIREGVRYLRHLAFLRVRSARVRKTVPALVGASPLE